MHRFRPMPLCLLALFFDVSPCAGQNGLGTFQITISLLTRRSERSKTSKGTNDLPIAGSTSSYGLSVSETSLPGFATDMTNWGKIDIYGQSHWPTLSCRAGGAR
jgi:hypothetical protein